jgi:NAD+ kinase
MTRVTREVLVVAHPRRTEVQESVQQVLDMLNAASLSPRVLADEAGALDLACSRVVDADDQAAAGVELVLVLGGDGSLLRGAELARPHGAPLLGVNLGHVGFLAEAEPDALPSVVERIVARDYDVEERMTIDVSLRIGGRMEWSGWALNEVALEKGLRGRMVECILEIEGRPLSRWACDGVVCATPTGSTAYAFSAGGPIVWPEVEALLVVPISAHALFARPLVVGTQATVALEVVSGTADAVLSCDGRRTVFVPAGARLEVTAGKTPVRLARVHPGPFTDRLVRKFDLPVDGWRGGSRNGGRLP